MNSSIEIFYSLLATSSVIMPGELYQQPIRLRNKQLYDKSTFLSGIHTM